MSDPVTNAEIEDVLASIRRLVSAEDRERPAPPEQEGKTADQEKLVLTPSLRIDESAAADAEGIEDPLATELESWEGTAEAPQDNNEAALEAPGAVAPEQGADAEAVLLETRVDIPDAGAEADDESAHAEREGDETVEAYPGADEGDATPLGVRIADLQAAVAARDEDWEPDDPSDESCDPGTVSALSRRDSAPADTDRHDTPAPDEPADRPDDPGHPTRGETAGAGEWFGHEEAAEPDAAATEADDDLFGDDDSIVAEGVLDEAALRDMVSEIVREELQGALGERITRNVRKLVRREIHRALASHELD